MLQHPPKRMAGMENSTIRDALNAIVRAHGTLAWAYQYTRRADLRETFPVTVLLFIGSSGIGVGIPRDATIGRVPPPLADIVTAPADPSDPGPNRRSGPPRAAALDFVPEHIDRDRARRSGAHADGH